MMRANIFQHELRRLLSSVSKWVLGMVALHLIYMAIFPSFADQAALLEESLQQFPKAFLQAFGMDRVSFATVLGYYTLVFLLCQVLLAIQAAGYGVGLVSREEADRTADFLLTRPVSRLEVLNSKLLAALTALLLTQAVLWVCAFGGWAIFHAGQSYDRGVLALVLLSALPFQLFFLSVGLAVSLLVRLVRNVTPYALGLGLGMYALSAFSDIGEEVTLEWLTPFKYFDAAAIVQRGALETRFVLLDLLIVVGALAFAYRRYLKRDIPTVT